MSIQSSKIKGQKWGMVVDNYWGKNKILTPWPPLQSVPCSLTNANQNYRLEQHQAPSAGNIRGGGWGIQIMLNPAQDKIKKEDE
jgi:hypothetical protein